MTPTIAARHPLYIAPGCYKDLAALPELSGAAQYVLISNPTVFALYGEQVENALKSLGKPVLRHLIPDGEAFKNQETLTAVYDTMITGHATRKSLVIALGGGVVGDLAGFAAATFMRGVDVIQLPTTLLAQVDASIGGKTAINHPLGKNLIGAFHQPRAVVIDTTVLSTLPAREVHAGLAEVIKYGAIQDADFWTWCETHAKALCALDPDAIQTAVTHACRAKAEMVMRDEKEAGPRALLNLGHTFGHAIEQALGYGVWLHGEAVGCGMVMAAQLSEHLSLLSAADVARVRRLVEAIGCPVIPPQMPAETWIDLMARDKKVEGDTLRFIVLDAIGAARIVPVSRGVLSDFFAAQSASASPSGSPSESASQPPFQTCPPC